MRVLKFGGSSVGTPERIRSVLAIVAQRMAEEPIAAVVVSAYQGVTNELLELGRSASRGDRGYETRLKTLIQRHSDTLDALLPEERRPIAQRLLSSLLRELEETLHGVYLLKEVTPKTLDLIASFGERCSAFTCAEAFKALGHQCAALDARAVVRTDAHFGNALVDLATTYAAIKAYFKNAPELHWVTGFIGSSAAGETTTLGRGGSDYTASLLGAALGAREIEIWTDVDGMLTADPRKVRKAYPIAAVTFDEALELCHFGAKVIYPPTLQPARDQRVPIRILNTFNPQAPGTIISHEPVAHASAITGVTSIDEVALLRIEGSGLIGVAGTAGRVFSALARERCNVILITQASSEHSICAAVAPTDRERALSALAAEFSAELSAGVVDAPIAEQELAVVSIVGENMRHRPGIAARLFSALARNGINVVAIAQGSSELNISVVIAQRDERKALRALHDAFFLSELHTAHIFVAGTGLIGSTLLRQIEEHRATLRRELSLELTVAGVCNTTRTVVQEDGIALSGWRAELTNAPTLEGARHHVESLADSIETLNLPHSIFLDCSASAEMAPVYERLLARSVPVITPNKKVQSGPLARYQRLKELSRARAPFIFETSVGAGLPVISTLADLLRSGDRILSIEAVLSGTLSYLFNTLCAGEPPRRFSEIVAEAKRLGFTEPDPRDDLNGLDAARKLLILARESGCTLELDQISIQRFLPEEVFSAPSVEDFFARLEGVDGELERRRAVATAAGKKLVYLGTLKENQAALTLTEVDDSHPFFSLSGTDNMVSFTTVRYCDRPLVIRGPGAGAEVTAAGIFADIVRVAVGARYHER